MRPKCIFKSTETGKAPRSIPELKESLTKYFGHNMAMKLIQEYHPDPGHIVNATEIYFQINGDVCVSCPNVALATMMRDQSWIWMYYYALGGLARHGSELPLIFHTHNADGLPNFSWPYDEGLSQLMSSVWTDFARDMHTKWSPVRGDQQLIHFMYFDDAPHKSMGYLTSKCQLLNSDEISLQTR